MKIKQVVDEPLTTPSSVTSATERKFEFRRPSMESESSEDCAYTNDTKTTILRCEVMSVLKEDLACTLCGALPVDWCCVCC
ncbi:hypothetical protein LSAT2_014916 [Lamellibrachia satsuma]|nr:hypothetical protein LSAT2_014916 [Lamellibrachia satsuma]